MIKDFRIYVLSKSEFLSKFLIYSNKTSKDFWLIQYMTQLSKRYMTMVSKTISLSKDSHLVWTHGLDTSQFSFLMQILSFRWKETQWDTNQSAVHSQVSAMNAATAQMVRFKFFSYINLIYMKQIEQKFRKSLPFNHNPVNLKGVIKYILNNKLPKLACVG